MKRMLTALRRTGTDLERALNILKIVSAEYAIINEEFEGEEAIKGSAISYK